MGALLTAVGMGPPEGSSGPAEDSTAEEPPGEKSADRLLRLAPPELRACALLLRGSAPGAFYATAFEEFRVWEKKRLAAASAATPKAPNKP